MGIALDEARAAPEHGDVPVGAVVVDIGSGALVARRHNERELLADPTAHAEILALRDAAIARGSWRLDGYVLVVTLEPCPMCAGAAVAARDVGGRVRSRGPEGRARSGRSTTSPPTLGSTTNSSCTPACGQTSPRSSCGSSSPIGDALGRRRSVECPAEGCESGRIGWSRKPLWGNPPWVQIPLPPPRVVTQSFPTGSGAPSPGAGDRAVRWRRRRRRCSGLPGYAPGARATPRP